MNYRRRPITVAALQFTGDNFDEVHKFLGVDTPAQLSTVIRLPHAWGDHRRILINGDWAVKEGDSFYALPNSTFEMFYEPVAGPSVPTTPSTIDILIRQHAAS